MQHEFDAMIDKAVTSYAAAEPSPDLAASILRRAQQQPFPERKGWKLTLALGLPTAAALALAMVLPAHWTLPKPPATTASVPHTQDIAVGVPPQPKTLAAATREPNPLRRQAHLARAARSWAPLPAPYTRQELALLDFVEQHPKEAAEIAKEQARPLKPLPEQPITISHLEIAPLTIASLDQEK